MSVKYNVIPRKDPRNLESPPKFYPSVVSSGHTGLREITGVSIGKFSTVSSVDTLAVLEALLSVVPEELARGQIVELGDLGSFRLTIETIGAATEGEVNAANIAAAHVRFTPGKLFIFTAGVSAAMLLPTTN